MLIRKLEEVENNTLHDAIFLTTLSNKYSFKEVYVDPNDECCVEFKGRLTEEDIKLFFFNMNPNVTSNSSPKDEKIEYEADYSYQDDVTRIYTKDGWKYSE